MSQSQRDKLEMLALELSNNYLQQRESMSEEERQIILNTLRMVNMDLEVKE